MAGLFPLLPRRPLQAYLTTQPLHPVHQLPTPKFHSPQPLPSYALPKSQPVRYPPRMPSKSQTSRLNGAKSRGPITESGRRQTRPSRFIRPSGHAGRIADGFGLGQKVGCGGMGFRCGEITYPLSPDRVTAIDTNRLAGNEVGCTRC